jgi:uncharacterized protein YlaI
MYTCNECKEQVMTKDSNDRYTCPLCKRVYRLDKHTRKYVMVKATTTE